MQGCYDRKPFYGCVATISGPVRFHSLGRRPRLWTVPKSGHGAPKVNTNKRQQHRSHKRRLVAYIFHKSAGLPTAPKAGGQCAQMRPGNESRQDPQFPRSSQGEMPNLMGNAQARLWKQSTGRRERQLPQSAERSTGASRPANNDQPRQWNDTAVGKKIYTRNAHESNKSTRAADRGTPKGKFRRRWKKPCPGFPTQ